MPKLKFSILIWIYFWFYFPCPSYQNWKRRIWLCKITTRASMGVFWTLRLQWPHQSELTTLFPFCLSTMLNHVTCLLVWHNAFLLEIISTAQPWHYFLPREKLAISQWDTFFFYKSQVQIKISRKFAGLAFWRDFWTKQHPPGNSHLQITTANGQRL